MTKSNECKLIEGTFSPEDAGTILFTLINSKINFHVLESFNRQVCEGVDHEHSRKRVAELQRALADIRSLLKEATERNQRVEISSSVHIKTIN